MLRKRKLENVFTDESFQSSLHNRLWDRACDLIDKHDELHEPTVQITELFDALEMISASLQALYFNKERSATFRKIHYDLLLLLLELINDLLVHPEVKTEKNITRFASNLQSCIHSMSDIENKNRYEKNLLRKFRDQAVVLNTWKKNHKASARLRYLSDSVAVKNTAYLVDVITDLQKNVCQDVPSQVENRIRALSLIVLELTAKKSISELTKDFTDFFMDSTMVLHDLLENQELALAYTYRCYKQMYKHYITIQKHLVSIDHKIDGSHHILYWFIFSRVCSLETAYKKFLLRYASSGKRERLRSTYLLPAGPVEDINYRKFRNKKLHSAIVRVHETPDRLIRDVRVNTAVISDNLALTRSTPIKDQPTERCSIVHDRKLTLCYQSTMKRLLVAAGIDDAHEKQVQIKKIQSLAFIEFKSYPVELDSTERSNATKIAMLNAIGCFDNAIKLMCKIKEAKDTSQENLLTMANVALINDNLCRTIRVCRSKYLEFKDKANEPLCLWFLMRMVKAIDILAAFSRYIRENNKSVLFPYKVDFMRVAQADAQFYVAARVIDNCLSADLVNMVERILHDCQAYQYKTITSQAVVHPSRNIRSNTRSSVK